MIETIEKNGEMICIIISHAFCQKGVSFLTENTLSQQLAFMQHPAGKLILPHVHNPVPREVHFTQEVLFIRKGKIRVDIYDKNQEYMESRILVTGDVILLATGGHGFEILEETEMIEVKQGPYAGDADKTRFLGIGPEQVKLPVDRPS